MFNYFFSYIWAFKHLWNWFLYVYVCLVLSFRIFFSFLFPKIIFLVRSNQATQLKIVICSLFGTYLSLCFPHLLLFCHLSFCGVCLSTIWWAVFSFPAWLLATSIRYHLHWSGSEQVPPNSSKPFIYIVHFLLLWHQAVLVTTFT